MDKSLKNILQIAIVAIALLAIIAATILFAGEDGFAKGTINGLMDNSTKGADDIVSKYIEDIDVTPIELAPGLYDNSNNLICSWESLVNDYGLVLDIEECDNMDTFEYVEGGKNLLYYIVYYFDEEDREDKPYTQFVGATKLVISDSVTTIGEQAFDSCSSLTSITIPNSVTTIGENAFDSCSSLTSITIPNSVTTFGKFAFLFCSSLTSITIPNSVTTVGNGAFGYCSSLTSITIPNSVTTVGIGAFDMCKNLGSISWNGKTYTLSAEQEDTELLADLKAAGICSESTTLVWSRLSHRPGPS